MRLFRKNLLFITTLLGLTLLTLYFFSVTEGKAIIILGGSLLLFTILLCYHLEKSINAVLEKIVNFSNILSEGGSDGSTFDRSLDYLYPSFSLTLNDNAIKLKNTLLDLNRGKNELVSMLDAMSEGVIVFSVKGTLNLVNKSASSMLQLDKTHIGKPYWETLRNKQLNEMLSETLKNQKGLEKEINTIYPEDKHYLASTILLDPPLEEIVIVIFDITEFKKLEKIKADFIANVSHELKTPLTSVKGYAETIDEGAYENQEEWMQFIKIIIRNTNRLISIVSDLLILSELEGKYALSPDRANWDFEKTSVNEMIIHAVNFLKRKSREKNIREKIELEDNLPSIYGIKFFLEQMLINLIDNAIKYNKYGGEIRLNSYKDVKSAVVKISDTGIGIPKEHQNRVFERFYRVDKNRSREAGGTGLGLSIVKHIVLVHGGSITLSSEMGKGSEFTVELPINGNVPSI